MTKKRKDSDADSGIKIIQKNKRAFHNYQIIEHLECGIALQGTEVKSLRDGNVNFADCYAKVEDGQLYLIGLNISEYAMGNRQNHDMTARRKLLAHRRQIRKLERATQEKGLTLVPLDLHWRRGLAKVELGVVRGKAEYDKRHTLKDREMERTRQRALRRH